MTFDHPLALCAFLIFIPMLLFDTFSDFRHFKRKQPKELQKTLRLSLVFYRMFLVFSVIAIAGPRWGTGFTFSEYRRGLDVVFAVDVSRSMDIRDVQFASRLEKGLLIAKESAQVVSGARFAVVMGRSRGYLAVPLSFDDEASLNFLESLDVSSITGRSTNLESLVETAVGAFQNTSPARKVIVLISDGESHSGILRNALNLCVRNGIILASVAVGSDDGSPVPAANDDQAVSRRDAAVMRMAAERTGGVYIDANNADAASILSTYLLSLAQETSAVDSHTESKQRRTLFIILAILAYGASKFVPCLLRGSGKLLVSMIAIIFIFASCSKGKLLLMEANYLVSHDRYDEAVVSYLEAMEFEDAAPYAEYGLGLTLYSLDEGTAALERYENSQKMLGTFSNSEHRELRYRNYYNSGIIYFEEGDFFSAVESFKNALRVNPDKIDAKRNLELSFLSIAIEAARENRTEPRSETREILFDYIKQHEQQYWKSGEWAPEETFPGPDY